jgi:hypothetical protein
MLLGDCIFVPVPEGSPVPKLCAKRRNAPLEARNRIFIRLPIAISQAPRSGKRQAAAFLRLLEQIVQG